MPLRLFYKVLDERVIMIDRDGECDFFCKHVHPEN